MTNYIWIWETELIKLTHEETENSHIVIREIESVVKEVFRLKWLHIWILVNVLKINNTNLTQTVSETRNREHLSLIF